MFRRHALTVAICALAIAVITATSATAAALITGKRIKAHTITQVNMANKSIGMKQLRPDVLREIYQGQEVMAIVDINWSGTAAAIDAVGSINHIGGIPTVAYVGVGHVTVTIPGWTTMANSYHPTIGVSSITAVRYVRYTQSGGTFEVYVDDQTGAPADLPAGGRVTLALL